MLISLKLVQRTKLFQLKMKCNTISFACAKWHVRLQSISANNCINETEKKPEFIFYGMRTIDVRPRGFCPEFSKLYQINERGDLKVCICG